MTIVAKTPDAGEPAHDRSLLNRRVWLAPICLCLVAALHWYRVTTAGQTPWKGGGFGMFSTFDAENARFVRAWLITSQGPRPIEIPSEFDKRIAELRAAPNQQGLDDLVKRLTARMWYDPAAARAQLVESLRNESGIGPLTGDRLRELRESSSQPITSASLSKTAPLVANKKNERRGPTIPFEAIRVELWKFEMPDGTTNLQAKLLLTSMQPAEEPGK
jgi:hypothetical protein